MAKTKKYIAGHFNNLIDNLSEVKRLVEIHASLAGSAPGHKHNVGVLNKSGVVLLVACWEAFIEDLAENAFKFMLNNSTSHSTFPTEVLVSAAKPLKNSKDNRDIWNLAGDGWKTVLNKHKRELIKNNIGKLNTPKPAQIDFLYKSLLGINTLSSKWYWHGMSAENARNKLTKLVELRGSIAHRVATSTGVHKVTVVKHREFINLLAVKSSNSVRAHILKHTGSDPWPTYSYGKVS